MLAFFYWSKEGSQTSWGCFIKFMYIARKFVLMKYFFSYSRHDSELVRKLAADLKNRNVNVWLDLLDIPVGAKWDTTIEHALDEAPGMILLLSKNSVQSDNVMDEVSYAIDNKKHIIPLLTDDCKVPFRVARIQQIDFTTDYSRGIEAIIDTIAAYNGTPQDEHTMAGAGLKPAITPTVAGAAKKPKYGLYMAAALATVLIVSLLIAVINSVSRVKDVKVEIQR